MSGSGLGLAIAKELTEAPGGTISISSVLNERTTVTLAFPAADTSGQEQPTDGKTTLEAKK